MLCDDLNNHRDVTCVSGKAQVKGKFKFNRPQFKDMDWQFP